MSLTYLERLICLIAVVGGTVHAGTELVLHLIAPFVLRLIESLRSRQRERFLFAMQGIPLLAGMFVTGALCVPQYLRTETNLGSERISSVCVLAALLIALWYGIAALRGVRIALRTMSFLRSMKRAGGHNAFFYRSTPVVVCPGMSGVALAGLLRPHILLSEDLAGASGLSGIALEIVLDHECSHARQFDNWKLFALNFVPTLGLKAARTWMELWQSAAEWAADDDAVKGESSRLLVLAETLVAVARTASPHPPMVWATLASANAELAARIDRLLVPRAEVRTARPGYVLWMLAMLLIGVVGLSVSRELPLHDVPEHVLHLR